MTNLLPTQAQHISTPRVTPKMTALKAAQKLEASFLAEMLKHSGLDAAKHAFSGGIGEDQFASFQRKAMAEALVQRGGIGLTEKFYNAMMEQKDDRTNTQGSD